jgi:acyl carrier protein
VSRPLRDDVIEDVILAAWREVLGVDLGLDDDVFDCGAHSLAIARVVARIRHELDVELEFETVFSLPTPRMLCEVVSAKRATSDRPTAGGGHLASRDASR